MPKAVKSLLPPHGSSLDLELGRRMEGYGNNLSGIGESEAFEPKNIKALTEDLDGNPGMVELFLEKIMAKPGLSTVRLLVTLNDQVTSKSVRKGIKRALYLLKQKGLAIPLTRENKDQGASTGILREMAPAQVSGYLSEFDESRSRMLALLLPKGTQGKLFVFALIDSEGELESLNALEVNNKESKRILEDLGVQAGHSFLKADPGQVAYIMKEAHDRRSHLSKEDESLWTLILNLLNGYKAVGHSPIIRSLFHSDQAVGRIFFDVNRLMGIPEMAYYLLRPEEIEPFRKSVQEVQEGILIISQDQKIERIQDIVWKAAEAVFQGEERRDMRLDYLFSFYFPPGK